MSLVDCVRARIPSLGGRETTSFFMMIELFIGGFFVGFIGVGIILESCIRIQDFLHWRRKRSIPPEPTLEDWY